MSETQNSSTQTQLTPITGEMEPQQISVDVLLEKYAKAGETTIDEIRLRVATAVGSKEPEDKKQTIINNYIWAMENGFIPAGRINSAAGSTLKATSVNCFVQSIGDSITDMVDGKPSIYTALAQAAETMRKGGGVGYNFSAIRPNQAYVKGTDSFASGPLSYMKIFNVSCETVESAGCFVGDTLIATNKGKVTIKYIIDHPEIEFFAHTHKGLCKIVERFSNGIKPVYKVKTEGGYEVTTTYIHKYAQYAEDGSIITRTLEDICKTKNHQVLILNNDESITEDIIVSCSYCGTEDTYDLEVENVHLLSGDGIYTSNSRRGAQMGMLNVDHPDIMAFVHAKDNGDFKNFNLSVAVTDEFMEAVRDDKEFKLVHKVPKSKNLDGEFIIRNDEKWYVYETIQARDLWDEIMKSTYDHAEPGIIFIDRVNTYNNLYYCETIEATNP